MAQSNKAKLISLSLEVELNKKASVSLFDRFGKDNLLFCQQFEDTQKSEQALHAARRRSAFETTLTSLQTRVSARQAELKVLKKFDRKELDRAADLADQVRELEEDLLTDLEVLDTCEPPSYGNLHETDSGGCCPTEDTILAWRVAGLPRAPRGVPLQ